MDWTEVVLQIYPPSQKVQEDLIPSKALETKVGVVSADFKHIFFRAVSAAEKIHLAPSTSPLKSPPPATFASPGFLHH